MDYLNETIPNQKLEDGTNDPEIKEERDKMILNFAKPGSPGSKFKNQYEKMNKCLTLPKGAKEELGISDDDNNNKNSPMKMQTQQA